MRKIFKTINGKSPTILSVMAIAGLVGTVVVAIKTTPKAVKKCEEKALEKGEPLTKTEVIKEVWKDYIPTVALGVGTIACVFGANILNKDRQRSLVSAYALTNTTFRRYSRKVKEIYGQEAHEKILQELGAETAKEVEIYNYDWFTSRSMEFDKNDENVILFYDALSKRYFKSTPSRVLMAEYHLNRNFALGAEPSLNNFYEFLGISPVEGGDVIGWDMCGGLYWIDFEHIKNVLDDGLEYYIISTPFEPDVLECYCSN